jgi:hypothetical protein
MKNSIKRGGGMGGDIGDRCTVMANKLVIFIFIIALIPGICASGKNPGRDRGRPVNQVVKATADLLSATSQYKASVEALLPIYERALKAATESFEKHKELYAQGIITRRDLETSEQAFKEAQARLDEARQRVTEADQLIAEANAEPEMTKLKPDSPPRLTAPSRNSMISAVLRYSGSGAWSLAQAAQVQSFFVSKFGRPLPISAYGQTGTHTRMGFDHRDSLDVAIHPDSEEGKALLAYLRSHAIPHIAFRRAVPGSATGVHVHVGYPSHRL